MICLKNESERDVTMAKLKAFINQLSVRQIVLSLTVIISLLMFTVLTLWSGGKVNSLLHQQAARRWDSEGNAAQVSGYFTRDTQVDEFQILSFEKQLESALQEAAVVNEDENVRLFIDAYCSQGKITVESTKNKLDANAIGIGGDFFLIHPLKLVSGGYFSGNDLMKDFIILDEEAAWQLFGSNDIVGMSVTIGGVPHYIAGVIERETGRFAESAGLSTSLIYVSNESLEAYGTSGGISTYEVVAPNPVKGFVLNTLKEKFGLDENKMVVVENSSRYSLKAMLTVLLDFGTRSMQNSAVSYPYWENIARGYEDVLALLLLFQMILLAVPVIIITVFLFLKWKNRTFTGKDIWNHLIDAKDRAIEKSRREKNKWEHF